MGSGVLGFGSRVVPKPSSTLSPIRLPAYALKPHALTLNDIADTLNLS